MSFSPRQEWDSDTVWLCAQYSRSATFPLSNVDNHTGDWLSLFLHLTSLYTSNHQRKHIRVNEASWLSLHSQKIKSYANGWGAGEETAMWDDGKTGHITQHYRSNEAVKYSRRRKIQVHATLGENLLAAWDLFRIYSVALEWTSWDVYFASPFSQISKWRDFINQMASIQLAFLMPSGLVKWRKAVWIYFDRHKCCFERKVSLRFGDKISSHSSWQVLEMWGLIEELQKHSWNILGAGRGSCIIYWITCHSLAVWLVNILFPQSNIFNLQICSLGFRSKLVWRQLR